MELESTMINMSPAIRLDDIPSAVSPSKPTSNPHVSYLDGLRGLAALFVVCHHIWQGPFGRLAHAGIKGLLCNWLLYGHLAVDAFIVLSGFCLVLPVAKSGTLNGGIWGFYARRARRILPPFYAALLLCLPFNYLTYRLGVHRPLVPMHALVGNLLLLQDWVPSINVLDGPTWSVAAEWKIYFLFPLFIWIWKRFNAWWIIPAAGAIGYGSMLAYHLLRPAESMQNTCPWYVFLFGMGLCAGIAAVRGREHIRPLWVRIVQVMALLGSAFLLLKYPVTSAGENQLYVPHLYLIDPSIGLLVATTLLVLYWFHKSGLRSPLLSLLSWRPLVFVGTFSYSIYLVHMPILLFVAGALRRIPFLRHSHYALGASLYLGVLPLVLVLAYIFYLYIERPFLNSYKSAPKRPLIPLMNSMEGN